MHNVESVCCNNLFVLVKVVEGFLHQYKMVGQDKCKLSKVHEVE